MATIRMKFTKQSLQAIKPPAKQAHQKGGVFDAYYDKNEKGLVLLVSNGGAKTFYFYGKVNNRPERIRLGSFNDLSVDAARRKAAEVRGKVASGYNPQDEKRAIRQDINFGDMVSEYLDRYSKKHKKTWKADEADLKRFLSSWFHKKASSITKWDVQNIHDHVGQENGPYQANRLLERVRATYNKSIEWGWKGSNPATGIKKFKEVKRDRFLLASELPYFFQALEVEANAALRDYILLSLLTGVRRSNMLAMRWDQVRWELAHWYVPKTKNDEPHIVPLSQEAIELLKERRKASQGRWVFPSDLSVSGHMTDPKKAWKRLLKRAEIFHIIDILAELEDWPEERVSSAKLHAETGLSTALTVYRNKLQSSPANGETVGLVGLRIHDLRRSLGSWQAIQGASGYIIGKMLGHKSASSTEIYARLSLDPVKQSLETATAAMYQAGGRKVKNHEKQSA